jgi:hypothetical protein
VQRARDVVPYTQQSPIFNQGWCGDLMSLFFIADCSKKKKEDINQVATEVRETTTQIIGRQQSPFPARDLLWVSPDMALIPALQVGNLNMLDFPKHTTRKDSLDCRECRDMSF